MFTVGILGNGPSYLLPDLTAYKEVDVWIGADRGAYVLIEQGIKLDYAVGDFDSIEDFEDKEIQANAMHYLKYPIEKDQTDLEIALLKAFKLKPEKILLFGVTGGRLDHELINIQLLYTIVKQGIKGIIVDRQNMLELTTPNKYDVYKDDHYPNISFVPYTKQVKGLSLEGFYYPLENETIQLGSTLCISNKLLSNKGTFFYEEGILLLIKSRDIDFNPIQQ